MATYQKRGKSYNYRVRYTDVHGDTQLITKSGFRTKADAVSAATKVEDLIGRGGNPMLSRIDFMSYWDRWLKAYKSGDKSDVTEYRYGLIRDHLERCFKDRELRSIKPIEWQEFINNLAAGKDRKHPRRRSKDFIGKVNSYVRSMVKSAINEQILFTDFTFGVHVRGVDQSDKVKFVDVGQFSAIKDEAAKRISVRNVTSLAVYIACMTGMRVSEVLALRWPNIHPKARTIDVDHSWLKDKQTLGPTKTPSSVRTIEVTQGAIDILMKYKHLQEEQYFKTGYRDPDEMVLRTQYHTIPTENACNHMLKSIETKVRIPEDSQITMHGLRHSHVSYLISKGIDIYYISRRLGHKNITVTMNTYGHLLDSTRKVESSKTVTALAAL